MKRAKTYYPLRIKKKAVQLVAAGLLSEDEACLQLKITSKLLHEWQRCGSPPGYDEYFIQPQQKTNPMPKKKLSDKERIKQLEQQLKESQQQLKHAHLKQEAYKTMIGIAEEEFDIKTVPAGLKKSLAPNSPKNEK